MKYTVKCEKCGKNMVIELFGKMEKREWIAEHGTHICDECKAAERDARNTAAAELNRTAGLPTLTGSDKQIAWAETIRAEKATALHGIGLKPEFVEAIIAVVMQQTSAAWWIDHRTATARDLMTLNKDAIMALKK